jgi:pimeloyl-ACP methyl ester carboxylesterase
MQSFLKRAENRVTKLLVGAIMPDLAKQMDAEGLFTQAGQANTEHLIVEDNGADVTIFSFSGFDVLYAGLARFEFRNVLRGLGRKANLVFVRDVHKTGFHLRPDGQPGGLEYFESEINAVIARLGSTHNVAIGSSSGGAAALWFASRCNMQETIVFGAVLSADGFTRPSHALRTVCAFGRLLREPRAYFEMLIVTIGAWWGLKAINGQFRPDELMNPLKAYAERANEMKTTFYYGAHSFADAWHARQMGRFERVRLVPLPTGRHNTPAFLKQRNQLAMALDAGISPPQWKLEPAAEIAPVVA